MSWPVSRILSGRSFIWGRRCRHPLATYPECIARATHHSCLVLLQTGFTMPRPLPARAVRSYRTFSPLPAPMARWRFIFCGTFHRLTAPGVIRRYALWSPDFPLHLADKATVQPTRFLLYGSIGAAIHNIGDLCKFMSGLRKDCRADIRVTHREGRLKGAISAHRLSLERFLSDGKIRSPMGGIQNVWIEQKLKIIGYAERHGKAACYDAFDVKARTLRRWRRLYREEWRWPYQTVERR